MNEAIERVKQAVLALAEPSWVEGTLSTKDLTIDGSVVDKKLADALVKKSELAPFGHGQETKRDQKVRSTLRLKSRGKTKITGLDLAPILDKISDTLSTVTTLDAKLLDVLIYPRGGKFLRHKDTPRTEQQLGTLIVEVPYTHKGGAMVLDDHHDELVVDWSKPAKQARWLALFGDVDHEIETVKAGHRITLVYILSLTKTARDNATLKAKQDTLNDAIITLTGVTFDADDWQAPKALYIPCTRLANAPAKGGLTAKMLRGNDRLIADAFTACGLPSAVKEIIFSTDEYPDEGEFPTRIESASTLKKAIPAKEYAGKMMLSFATTAGGEYLEGVSQRSIAKIGKYIESSDWFGGATTWFVRPKAEATVMWSGDYSESGYFGNEGGYGRIYKTAAIRVSLDQLTKKKKKGKPKLKTV
ncbi:MAG: hypothetical protein QM831_18565 [Kofleriaceae bacterium]